MLSQRDEVCAQAYHNNCKYDDGHWRKVSKTLETRSRNYMVLPKVAKRTVDKNLEAIVTA